MIKGKADLTLFIFALMNDILILIKFFLEQREKRVRRGECEMFKEMFQKEV